MYTTSWITMVNTTMVNTTTDTALAPRDQHH